MRLTELSPKWVRAPRGGPICGVRFKNPMDQNQNLYVLFKEPIFDGGETGDSEWPEPGDNKPLWARTGDTFETLTLSPSINIPRLWHGHITNGEVTTP